MKIESLLLDQPMGEVQAAMTEEDCSRCFGCPISTVVAAELVHRSTMLLDFVYSTGDSESDFFRETEQEVEAKRKELNNFTSNCIGYSDEERENSRPAKMCDSPDYKYPRISILAGKILEKLGI